MIKIGILGCFGRMGESISRCAKEEKCQVVAGSISCNFSEKKICDYPISTDAQIVFQKADVVLDFSHFSAASAHIQLAEETKTPLLIGTTGHQGSPWSETKCIPPCPILYAQNTTIGIQCLIRSVLTFCKRLSDLSSYDISVEETHHYGKKDSPSGTALLIRDILSSELKCSQDIRISSVRKGHVPGKHEVIISNPEESFVFSHEATSRDLFARGALRFAQWLLHQKPGFYTLHTLIHDTMI